MKSNGLFCKKIVLLILLFFSSIGFLYAEDPDSTFGVGLNLYAFGLGGNSFEEDDDPSGINMNIYGTYDISPCAFIGANIGLPFWFWGWLTSKDEETYEKNDITVDPSDKVFTFSVNAGLDYTLLEVIRTEGYVECGFIANSWAGGAGASLSLFLAGFDSYTQIGVKADYGFYYGYSVEAHEWTPFQKLALALIVMFR